MMGKQNGGYLVISLDFELHWGMFDKVSIEEYGPHYKGVRVAIPELLSLFAERNIHATWATVGMLMCRSKKELEQHQPPEGQRPEYINERLSAYYHLHTAPVGASERDDPYHFGASLVDEILATPGQELASHTWSHFYANRCRKNSGAVFAADCRAQTSIFETYNVVPTSIVFPRNQATAEAINTAHSHGITAYRGNENHFLYRSGTEQSLPVRGLRLLDAYLNLSGHHTYPLPKHDPDDLVNLPASRFLRPYSRKLRFLESMRLQRIKHSMTHASKRGEVFHLWWHPHNFGANRQENMENLKELIAHFESLRESYGMESRTMQELTTLVNG